MNLKKYLQKYLCVDSKIKNSMIDILPYELIERYNYILVNNNYVSILCVKKHINSISLFNSLSSFCNSNMLVHTKVFKIDNNKFLKTLHNIISNVSSEKSSITGEQIDIDILNNIFSDAKKLRYFIQVKGQDIYETETYIVLFHNSEENLKQAISEIISLLYSKGVHAVPLNFRQKQAYVNIMPSSVTENLLHKNNCEIYTTETLTAAFPFYQKNMLEENGIFIGYAKENLCMLDFMCEHNNNKNMVVFGSSGAGKSYFIKNMILQYLYKGVKQIIIDPLGEYASIAKSLGQTYKNINNINIFEMDNTFILNNMYDFLDKKIKSIIKILGINENEDLSVEDIAYNRIYNNILKIYNEYDIYSDIEYISNNMEKIKSSNISLFNFPPVIKIKEILDDVIISKKVKNNLQKKIHNICNNYIENIYQVESKKYMANDLIVYDVNKENINEEYLKMIIFNINNSINKNVLLYIDEMWQFVNYSYNINLSEIITEWFKNIRHNSSGIIAITQDIADILEVSNGSFGKSILNNSYSKVYFKMEYLDLDNFLKLLPKNSIIYNNIKKLNKGEALIDYGSNIFKIKVKAFEYEDKLIREEGCFNEESFNCNG